MLFSEVQSKNTTGFVDFNDG